MFVKFTYAEDGEYDKNEIYSYVPLTFPDFMDTVHADEKLSRKYKMFLKNFRIYVDGMSGFDKMAYHKMITELNEKYQRDVYFVGESESLVFIFTEKECKKIMNNFDAGMQYKMEELCSSAIDHQEMLNEARKCFQKKLIMVQGGKHDKK